MGVMFEWHFFSRLPSKSPKITKLWILPFWGFITFSFHCWFENFRKKSASLKKLSNVVPSFQFINIIIWKVKHSNVRPKILKYVLGFRFGNVTLLYRSIFWDFSNNLKRTQFEQGLMHQILFQVFKTPWDS